MDSGRQQLRIGTRGSLLATTQTHWVVAQLQAAHPTLDVQVEIIQTTGDLRRDIPFAQVGTKGMFVKEIEQALLDGTIDLGVHSLKDMPSELPEGLELACIPSREDPRDAFLSPVAASLAELPPGAVLGTSSMRRQAQVRAFRPDLQVRELRGNLDTRLRKLDKGDYDGILLACAGLNRLGLGARITAALDPDLCVPAVGQGALALEIRADDAATRALLVTLHDPETADAVAAERGFQTALGGGCTVPAGALATIADDTVTLLAVIAAPDGSQVLRETGVGNRTDGFALGDQVAKRLLERGGSALLKG